MLQIKNNGNFINGDAKILLYNGENKYIQNITQNDILMGDDFKPRRIIELYKGYKKLYKIVLEDGYIPLLCNDEHILLLKYIEFINFK